MGSLKHRAMRLFCPLLLAWVVLTCWIALSVRWRSGGGFSPRRPGFERSQESKLESLKLELTRKKPGNLIGTTRRSIQNPKSKFRNRESVTSPFRAYTNLPQYFEVNQGQTDPRVKFLSRGHGYSLFLTENEAVLALQQGKSKGKNQKTKIRNEDSPREPASSEVGSPTVLRMRLLGSNPAPRVLALEELPGKSNYYIGNDPQKWRTNVANYAKVKYRDVYPGVDLVYYGNQRRLENDFVVAPGADPGVIRLGISGTTRAARPRIDTDGDLVVKTRGGDVRFHKPVVYQMQSPVAKGQGSDAFDDGRATTDNPQPTTQNRKYLDGRFVLAARNEIRFKVGRYDTRRQLIIDPMLTYSTYLGGNSLDSGNGIAVDSAGSAYVTGETASTTFPTTPGAYRTSNAGASDVFVTKFDPTGTLVYSTYIGGTLAERGTGIAVDSDGNAYITGRTNSTNFPTMNGFQIDLLGDFDAFITKLNAQGNALLYSTYLGGSGNDEGSAIAVDASGNAYVTGGVGIGSRDDFPTTPDAVQPRYNEGMNDAFVTKIDPTQSGGASLIYSSFLGGSDIDRGNSIAVDSAGIIYVTGRTRSNDFLLTQTPLQPMYGGGLYDAFVAKIDPAQPGLAGLIYSTYLGGSGRDQGYGIAADAAGNAYVTGETTSGNFPTTAGAYQSANAGGTDAFMATINSDGSALIYSTYLGGSSADIAFGIALDTAGIAYVTGRTASSADFPITTDAIQPTYGGGLNDAFVAKIDPSQSGEPSLVYSSYLGGSGDENIPPTPTGAGGNPSGAIAVDASGNAFVTGNTSSTADFPLVNSIQGMFGGGPSDAFVVMITSTGTRPSFLDSATPEEYSRLRKSAR
jgi:hypothetical protein